MRPSRVHRPLAVWIAALALLLGAFAPALSTALKPVRVASWIDVCTVHGAQRVPAGSQQPDRAPALSHLLGNCPCCVGHAPATGLPPAAETGRPLPLLGLTDEYPVAFLSGPRTLHAWAGAYPRAPPLPDLIA